ncbi:Vacuolar protein sorting-associated protein 62 [Serendipita sp. 405]|nr:Vacuolar protein sorting-associated protein 62 [Serendipita sp. 397]KAG8786416.1 Vacuolar protein sorting-associated protein 62 [Serendipita sp. 398]KAG8841787.1 Vacuolar protein sorting-associated protein 62 [Serendipita sp. 405]
MALLNVALFVAFTLLIRPLALAAPTDQNSLLARRYAPQFRFHKDEVYFPSTVEYFLTGPVTLTDASGKTLASPLPKVSSMSNFGAGTFMTTDTKANLNGFLRGQNPNTAQPSTYVFVAPKSNGVVDLYYWVYCPYNLGKKVPLLGMIGDHVGDWERITIRTVNGVATSIDYHAHDDKGSGTIPWTQAPKFSSSTPNGNADPNNSDPDARPVAYIAYGSHGMWSKAGTFTYIDAVVFKLQDVTSDQGVYWDTKDHLVPIGYPETYTESLEWLNYQGTWGNKGATNCWWYWMYKQCELVTGPNGPLRADVLGSAKSTSAHSLLNPANMRGPLSQTLASISTGDSQYTIYLDTASVLQQASPIPQYLSLVQTCATHNTTSTASSDEPEYSYSSTYSTIVLAKGKSKYNFSVSPCDPSAFVATYSVGLCASDLSDSATLDQDLTDCSFGAARRIRAFSTDPSITDIQEVSSVVVEDLDDWSL